MKWALTMHCMGFGQVTEGSGEMLVIAVGVDSEWGRTMAMVQGEAADTPLQEALAVLAAAIGKVGLAVGIVCFIVLLVRCDSSHHNLPHTAHHNTVNPQMYHMILT